MSGLLKNLIDEIEDNPSIYGPMTDHRQRLVGEVLDYFLIRDNAEEKLIMANIISWLLSLVKPLSGNKAALMLSYSNDLILRPDELDNLSKLPKDDKNILKAAICKRDGDLAQALELLWPMIKKRLEVSPVELTDFVIGMLWRHVQPYKFAHSFTNAAWNENGSAVRQVLDTEA